MNTTNELAKLSNSLQLTIKIIHAMYEKGESLRYTDIKKARIEAGMAEGSDTTVKRAFDEWQRIYGIQYKKFESGDSVENLVKKTIESLRDELKQSYQSEADIKIAAADEEIDTVRTALNEAGYQLEQKTSALASEEERCESLLNDNETLKLELEQVKSGMQQLTAELGKATVTIANKEQYVKKLEQDLVDAEKKYQGVRADMELQRQSQMKLIDDAKQEVKQINKKNNDLQTQLDRVQGKMNESERKLAVGAEKIKLLEVEQKQFAQLTEQAEKHSQAQIEQLEKENSRLQNLVAKLEGQLEVAEKGQAEFNHKLMAQLKTMQNKPKKKAKA